MAPAFIAGAACLFKPRLRITCTQVMRRPGCTSGTLHHLLTKRCRVPVVVVILQQAYQPRVLPPLPMLCIQAHCSQITEDRPGRTQLAPQKDTQLASEVKPELAHSQSSRKRKEHSPFSVESIDEEIPDSHGVCHRIKVVQASERI